MLAWDVVFEGLRFFPSYWYRKLLFTQDTRPVADPEDILSCRRGGTHFFQWGNRRGGG